MSATRPIQLLTFLGTGSYTAVPYRLAAQCTAPEPFVQVALVKLLAQQARPVERVTVCLTAAAAEHNWELARLAKGETSPRPGLEPGLQACGVVIEPVESFPEGRTEAELWTMFERITAAIRPDHDLVVDVTHGFRCFPIVLCIALAFLKQVQGLHLRQVYYGAFDAKDEQGVAPVFDLSPLLELLDWSTAVSQLLDTGNATRLANRIAAATQDGAQPALREYGQAVGDLAAALSAAAAAATATRAAALAALWPQVAQLDLPPELAPVQQVLQPIRERYAPLAPQGEGLAAQLQAQLAAAQLLFDHRQWQAGYTLLEEVQLEIMGRLLPGSKRATVGSRVEQLPNRAGAYGARLAASYRIVSRHRNALNHAWQGGQQDFATHQGLEEDGPREVATMQPLVAAFADPPLRQDGRRLLVVLNHDPTAEQLADAERELQVTAVVYPAPEHRAAFANVDATADLLEGRQIAPWLVQLHHGLLTGLQPGDCALIQGEPGVTCYLVQQFERQGIACYHATTRRDSVDETQSDGSVIKRAVFRHVKLRRYRV
ncbi:MAG: TIGR02221 family CRISPR-associated protein [Fimbriimonadaceae bacterium]|nr:TIGR02221 family CRISPR-associated protein [Fimbriimonadaceae bacterium]